MTTALTFQSTTFNAIDHQGQPWLIGTEISHALGYSRADRIAEIYKRNAAEFTPAMTLTRKLRVKGFGNGYSEKGTRIFSLQRLLSLFMFTTLTSGRPMRYIR